MKIDIDQSGKLDFSGPSIFAFSNGEKRTLYVPHEVKNKVNNYYSGHPHFSKGTMRKRIKVRFFAACVALLLTQVREGLKKISVDNENDGYQEYLKSLLVHRLNKTGLKITEDMIEIISVGKNSPADILAGEVGENKKKPDLVASFENLSPFL